ncbi:MAG: alpha-galactosidase [Selenomonadaceae bacterium]|nr:alpha-galactosidase [Selenomonadaceae bacterium]
MIKFENQKFHLSNEYFSYVIEISRGKHLLHRYWGKTLKEFRDSAPLQAIDRANAGQLAEFENERTYSLDVLPQEYPVQGHTDFRIPAYRVEHENGTNISELNYSSYKIIDGKPALKGLPASFGDNCQTLEIELVDICKNFTVYLYYTIFDDSPILARSAKFVNTGGKKIKIRHAASAAIDFNENDFDIIDLYGGHAAERTVQRHKLQRGIFEVSSTRGASSHQHSPFIALARPDATEFFGEVYAASFVYSGSFAIKIEAEQFGTTRLVVGLNPDTFSWLLEPNEEFQTPEVILNFSANGLNGMSQSFHKFFREHLMRGKFKDQVRPILINNWEATYFDFNEEKIIALADCAKELGLELVVLDDGWFGKRNDDNSSLGDWFVNREKLPNGIEGLVSAVHERGLKFGIWVEPEMVNVDSDLYRAHPDWILHVPDYKPSFSRHQLVLDLSRADVREYVLDAMRKVFSSAPIDYVKWDYNRHMTEAFSAKLPPERQLETQHRVILGLYEIMEKLVNEFPDILFESCSGGGGRFDAGFLYYMPQTWTSDDSDAVCRLSIQTGTGMAFPIVAQGAHVSVVPNHQVGRVTTFQMRNFVAMCGTYGFELDITRFTAEEKDEVKKYVELYKEIRPTMQLGKFTRLLTAYNNGNEYAWQFEDENRIVVVYFRVLSQPATPIRILKLAGLNPAREYHLKKYFPPKKMSVDGGKQVINFQEKSFYGDELMNNGLAVEKIDGDFAAYMWVFEK